ncbi:hypothetical protein BN2475_630031 [Paraburkholderia ribeironis]|uniref:Uncharacterized protein n=1 Tax=Paraburkholderia ribeironis TaxID=1247936 RepID=A0A1N7SFQ6_9BURK|nr:hypothetical protein BN2475_630031 [Paraburkholderia ribeironis]
MDPDIVPEWAQMEHTRFGSLSSALGAALIHYAVSVLCAFVLMESDHESGNFCHRELSVTADSAWRGLGRDASRPSAARATS